MVYISLGGGPAQGNAQGTGSKLRIRSHGDEHMGGKRRAGRAGRPAGNADSFKIEGDYQMVAIQALEAEMRAIGQALLRMAVKAAAGNFKNALLKFLAPLLILSRAVALFKRQGAGRAESHDRGHVLSAAATVFLLMARDSLGQSDSLANIKRAHSLGGVDLIPP